LLSSVNASFLFPVNALERDVIRI